jgi:hypothetical protein
MKIRIELSEKDLKNLVLQHIQNKIDINVKVENIHIEVKSNQSYKSEWEEASFRATYERTE